MKISLCMIVKDEVATLEKGLISVRDYVDEIIIVDTGSTDGTVEIAKKYADIFKEIEWPDSMSIARNVSLELATGDYIMILDGDEYFGDDADLSLIHKKFEENPDAIALKIFNHLPPGQAVMADWVWQVRLWKNLPTLRYEGRAHNQISGAMLKTFGKEAKICQVFVEIQHMGYNLGQEEMIKKYESRMHLYKLEIDEDKDPMWTNYYRFQMGNAFFMTRDFDSALYILNQIDPVKLTPENSFSMHLMRVHANLMVRRLFEANKDSNILMETWPHEPVAFMMKGICLMELQKWEAGLNFLLTCLQRIEKPLQPIKYHLDAEYVCAPAGEAALKANRLGEAKGLFQRYLSKFPDNEQIADLERRILKADGSDSSSNGLPPQSELSPENGIDPKLSPKPEAHPST